MIESDWSIIDKAERGAMDVLRHNSKGSFHNLPRTAGWGYPEPYTRDLLISLPGILLTGDKKLISQLKRVLVMLAENQSLHGHIPSLVHDRDDRGASDTTPLFLVALAIFRHYTGEKSFLEIAAEKAITWMEYQSPADDYLVAQQPTTDWRDELWVPGYGLYVNTLVYAYLRLLGFHDRADGLLHAINHFVITGKVIHKHVHEGLVVKKKPYYALWAFKLFSSERFDLLGNSLAILFGLASASRSKEIISWISKECDAMKINGDIMWDLPPNFFPFIKEDDPDWRNRYKDFNMPGEYHNGGIWPFIIGFYIAAIVAVGKFKLAEDKLVIFTQMISSPVNKNLTYGFNEWIKAQTGRPAGQDWQTWSAAMYIYAVHCVRSRTTPFFDEIRNFTHGDS